MEARLTTMKEQDSIPGRWGRNPDATLGYGILRLTLGMDFLFHSSTRWAHVGQFAEKIVGQFASTPLPPWSVRCYAIAITIWEPIVGLLLVLGLRTRDALGAGGLLIASLVFGTALRADFTVLSEQLVYAFIFFLLLLYRQPYNRWSLDTRLEK